MTATTRRAASLTGLSLACDECGARGLRLLRVFAYGAMYRCQSCKSIHLRGGER